MSTVPEDVAHLGAIQTSWLQVVQASHAALLGNENAVGEVPGTAEHVHWVEPVCTAPMLVPGLIDAETARGVGRWLRRYYPDTHPIQLVGPDRDTRELPLAQLESAGRFAADLSVIVPPLSAEDNVRTFSGIMDLTRTLRAPGGCPWDREQTHASLKPHLLEEAYEVIEALESGDAALLREELGDLLFQVTIHSQVAAEEGEFTIEDVIQGITCKLIGRHPHVFGDMTFESAQDVRHAWEDLKQKEKPKRTSVLEQIPRALPALPQSSLMQKRAASVGFEWPDAMQVLDKVEEELEELRSEIRSASPREQEREEFGDILFALVSAARHLRIDPEEALRLANRKFAARFKYVESRVAATGRSLRELSPEELDSYWQEAKGLGVTWQAPEVQGA